MSNGGQTEDDVLEALNILYADFAPHNIYFVWDCNIDYIDDQALYNLLSSDVYGYPGHFDPKGINLYLGRDIGMGDCEVTYALAFSTPANQLYLWGNHWKPPYNPLVRSHFLSHEVGHCLGLDHTFDNYQNCNYQGTNCSTCGDYVCDTPADPGIGWCVDPATCEWIGKGVNPCPNCNLFGPNTPVPTFPNTNIPYTPDTKNMMAYAHPDCMEYFSLGQGQRMRNIIATEQVLTNTFATPSSATTEITATTTYNTPMDMPGDIVVKTGYKLTIATTVRLKPLQKIVVEPGAELVLNGATLTRYNTCDLPAVGYWRGIELQPTTGTNIADASRVSISNSVIEYADKALFYRGTGSKKLHGIVNASNSVFRKNLRAIEFSASSAPTAPLSKNTFIGCRFLTDGTAPLSGASTQVSLTSCRGTIFSGCIFENSGHPENYTNNPVGIYAFDTPLSVQSHCYGIGATDPCADGPDLQAAMKGYKTGIQIDKLRGFRALTVREVDFSECEQGIFGGNSSDFNISRNDFTLGGYTGASFYEGINFTKGDNFNIFDNAFSSTGPNTDRRGIALNTPLRNFNQVSDNDFDSMTGGIEVKGQGAGGSTDPNVGLTFACNIFTDSQKDILNQNGPIAPSQGTADVPAGNKFSYYPGADFSDFDNQINLDPPNYFFYVLGPNEEPLDYQGLKDPTAISTPNLNCGQGQFEERSLGELDALYQTWKSRYDSLNLVRQNYLSSGGTSQETLRPLNAAITESGSNFNDIAFQATHRILESESPDIGQLVLWIERHATFESGLDAADTYLYLRDYLTLEDKLDELPTKFTLSEQQQDEIELYRDLVALYQDSEADGRSIAELDSIELGQLESLAYSGAGYVKNYARSILKVYYGYTFEESGGRPVEKKTLQTNQGQAQVAPLFKVFPNPSTDGTVYFSFLSSDSNCNDCQIEVRNVLGRIVHRSSADGSAGKVSGLSPGFYLVTVVVNGARSETHSVFVK